MKIRQIDVYKKDLGNAKPYSIAYKVVDEVWNVIVRVTLENGMSGLGACNPSSYVVNEDVDKAYQTLSEENISFLIGRDIRSFYALVTEVQANFSNGTGARTALDIALHDVFTKYLEVPLGSFLGQKIQSLPTSVTIGIMNVDKTLEEAREFYETGFRILKVKIGNELEEDVARIARLREVHGDNVAIRVDANQGYDSNSLLEFCRLTERMNVEFIEQPLPFEKIKEMESLPDDIKAKIAIDENLINPKDALNLATPPFAGHIFNIKLMKSGGIYPSQQIADIAAHGGLDLMWGCNDESRISISAALHTALAYNNTKYLDLDGSLDLVQDIVNGGFEMNNGFMSIVDKPGLGVTE